MSSRLTGRLLAASALGAVIVTGVAMPAAAAAPPRVSPTASCVWDNGDGTYTGVFGYTNTGGAGTIPVGTNNEVYVGHNAQDYWTAGAQPQPTNFVSGTVANAFSVSFPADGGAAWSVNGTYTTLQSTNGTCATEPMDVTSDGPLTLVAFGLLVPLGAYFLSRPSTRLHARRGASRPGGAPAR